MVEKPSNGPSFVSKPVLKLNHSPTMPKKVQYLHFQVNSDQGSQSQMSASVGGGNTSRARRKLKMQKSVPLPKKETKVIGGHLMAIRDKRRGTVLEHHIYDHHITDKDFGK